jgi:hypothetical protein
MKPSLSTEAAMHERPTSSVRPATTVARSSSAVTPSAVTVEPSSRQIAVSGPMTR